MCSRTLRPSIHDRRVLREDRTNVARNFLVDLKARLHEDQVGTLPLGGDRRHRDNAQRAIRKGTLQHLGFGSHVRNAKDVGGDL
jgi:hypothetical protein